NVGTGLLLIGYTYMLLVLDATIPIWVVSIGMVIIGLGLGQLLQTTTVASQNSVHGRDIGVATSSITFFRQMGGTFGVAVFMSILFSQVTQKVVAAFDNPATQAGIAEALSDRAVTSDPANAAIIAVLQNGAEGASEITIDSSFLIGADDRLTLPFRIGFVESSLGVFLLATLFVGVAFVISFFIKEIPLRDKSAAQEAAESTGI
ncbi:MAG: MFS transporter, partial [Aquiluna sp.]|nr:MFS transporter [Aquiluna sp.]